MLELINSLLSDFLNDLLFLFQRLTRTSILDIFLVAAVIFAVLIIVRDTQAVVLLRGVTILIIVLALLTTMVNLPAFSWLLRTTLPALVFAIPVIFAPEIRRALERLGRAGPERLMIRTQSSSARAMTDAIHAIVNASARLSARRHGALIILSRSDSLQEYIESGVITDSKVTPEILLQIFYPNTPLHDGAIIITEGRMVAASCVMPLSSSGVLTSSPERQMGLRHRAALGISEASDAIAVVVSEETGGISISHGGRMIRRLDAARLENILLAFYRPNDRTRNPLQVIRRLLKLPEPDEKRED
ncbi:MAG: diadenylate cyclase CdaA [Anaerolineaceae bacterium]|nr:diadenylate cyclase CdaA [Anaerolineaceae bacterium]